MATQGVWLGQWPGEWFGQLSDNDGFIAAQLYGSSSISASLTFVSSETIAALSGGGGLSGQLTFAVSSGVSSKEKKKTKPSKHFGGNSPIGHEVYANRVLSSELAEQIKSKLTNELVTKPSLDGVAEQLNAIDAINLDNENLLKNSLLITNELTINNQIKIELDYQEYEEIAQIIALLL